MLVQRQICDWTMGLHACMTCRVMACCEHPAEPPDKQLCASGAGAWGLSPERQCAPHARAAQRRPSPSGHRYVTLLTSKPRTSPLSLSTGHQQPPHVQAASPIPYPGDPGARLVQVLRLARGGQDAAHARAVQRRPGRRAGPVGRQARVDVEHARHAQRHRVHGRAHQRPRAEHACAGAGAVSGDRAPDCNPNHACPWHMASRHASRVVTPAAVAVPQPPTRAARWNQGALAWRVRRRELHDLPVRVRRVRRLRPEERAHALPCAGRGHARSPSRAGGRRAPASAELACMHLALASGLRLEMALTADRPLTTACRPGRRRQRRFLCCCSAASCHKFKLHRCRQLIGDLEFDNAIASDGEAPCDHDSCWTSLAEGVLHEQP